MSPLFHDSIYDRDERPEKEGYDTAQICLNGHCVNSSYTDFPKHNQDYCTTCGKPTITGCKKCNAPIRGYLRGSMSLSSYTIPLFCYKCGESYPWTQDRLMVAIEFARELDGLNDEERNRLVASLDDLVREGPKTTLAATRFKKIVSKAGGVAAESFKKILVDIASETARKMIWPDVK